MSIRYQSLYIAALMLFLSATLAGCNNAGASADSKENEEETVAIPVETAFLSNGSISSSYSTTAILEAKEEAFVVARASGIIREILVEEGDYVERGQNLAKLETERYKLNLQRAKANLAGIEKELAKVKDMHKRQLVSDDMHDKLSAQYDAAKANLEIAELDLSETVISAPISGYIAERNAKVGNLTESFQRERMFHIVQQKELYGIVHLPEKELPRVHVDQKATLNIAALGDDQVMAYVERISPVIDATTGTFKVTLRVPNDSNRLKAGMFSEVNLNYDTRDNALLLSRRAIINQDNQTNVFVVKDGIASKVAVETGYQQGEWVEILSGLQGDEQVVTTGQHNLKDEATVEIVNS